MAGLTKKMTASNILLSQRASLGKENKDKRQKDILLIPETLPKQKRKKTRKTYLERKNESDAGNEERCVLQEDLFSS